MAYTAKKEMSVRYTNAPIKTKVKMGNKQVISRALVKPSATNLVPSVHVKRGDLVMVISGCRTRTKKNGQKLEGDRGKIGKVLKVFPKLGKILVEGVNVVTRHVKAKNAYGKSGIIKQEAPLFACKVMLYSNEKKKPVRAEFRKELGV
ncbi:MAG: 50S ribosomal protein L24 [Candidatus Obscuribacterales bacterium]|jgi:large subunit ribosomal protein L24|nr:50S ribosomal protein L24 [Candidatus Melainabacteria bacterium]